MQNGAGETLGIQEQLNAIEELSSRCSDITRFGFARLGTECSEEQDIGNVKVDSELIDKDGKITMIMTSMTSMTNAFVVSDIFLNF